MKVLVVTTSFPQKSNPNSGFFIKQLIVNFSKKIEITVVTPADKYKSGLSRDGKFTQVNFAYGPACVRTLAHAPGGLAELQNSKLKLLFLPVLLVIEFITTLKWSFKCDLIHANWSINGIIAGIAGKISRKPVVTTVRGSDINKIESSNIYYYILKICLLFSCKVVTVNNMLKYKIIKIYPKYNKEIDVIENGIEDSFFQLQEKIICDDNKIKILVIGNLTKNKSVDTIFKAINREDIKNIKVDVVGDGPERDSLQKLAHELGLADRIIFHGTVAADNRINFFRDADILAFASISEGRPNVILEAMASGLCIITSDIEAVQDLVTNEESALTFETGNSGKCASQLKRLLDKPELRLALGRCARNRVYHLGLTWQNAAKKYEMLYEEVIGS